MKLIVWGCNGFVASLICVEPYIQRYDQIIGVDVDDECNNAYVSAYFSFKDELKQELWRLITKGDEVINCAAISNPRECSSHPDSCVSTNEVLTKEILRYSIMRGAAKIVYFSSFHSLLSPGSPYGQAKLNVERFIMSDRSVEENVTCLRLGSVVTKDQPVHNRLRNLICSAIEKNRIDLDKPFRSRSYIDGCCFTRVYWAIHNSGRKGIINCWGSDWVTDLSVAKYVARQLEIHLPLRTSNYLASAQSICEKADDGGVIATVKIKPTIQIIDAIIRDVLARGFERQSTENC